MRQARDTYLHSIEAQKDAKQREADRRAEAERQRRNEVRPPAFCCLLALADAIGPALNL